VNKNALLVLLIVAIFLAGCGVSTPTSAPVQPEETLPEEIALPTNPPETEVQQTAQAEMPESTPNEAQVAPTAMPCSGVLTSRNQEGPYYTPGSPEKGSLIEEGMPGTPILISGGVFDQNCNPIPGAKVDFWQADANGAYDNSGYRLRGHVFSDEHGVYAIESIEPGLYTGRPPHIHVKVFAPDGRELLTTQMYFPGSEESADVRNAPDLYATYIGADENGRQQVLFNFTVQY